MLLRPPYGLKWIGMREVQRKLSLLAVMWTVIGYDWRWPAKQIASHVLAHSSPGGIICLHDGHGVEARPDVSSMLEALQQIVPVLQDEGYTFETVSDLMQI